MMVRREKMLISKHSITAPFFPVKRRTAYFFKAYSARFYTGGVRLFLRCPAGGAKFFHAEFTARSIKQTGGDLR